MSTTEDTNYGGINANFADWIPRPVKTYHRDTYPRVAPSQYSAAGKTVFITGGPTGIGYSIAKSFAEAGAERIVIVSRSLKTLAEAKASLAAAYPKVQVETYSVSINDHAEASAVLKGVKGGIDILVLSAAAVHMFQRTDKIPINEMQNSFDTNVVAQVNLVNTYLGLPTPASGSKTIINISTAAIHQYFPDQAGYGASKLAFYELLRRYAAEQPFEGEQVVRMFSFQPGAFYTPLAASTGFPSDALPWEDINLPGHFAVWLALSGEADFLHGKFVWAQWDVDELIALKERVEKEEGFLRMTLHL